VTERNERNKYLKFDILDHPLVIAILTRQRRRTIGTNHTTADKRSNPTVLDDGH
jgi:hypothetical protein